MNGLQLTPAEYVTAIAMSKDLFLLLEGSDDEIFFTKIYNELRKTYAEKSNLLKKIRIETAEQIKGSSGNREKIENICNLILEESEIIRGRVLGFVDREFREFYFENEPFCDNLKTHKINGRLIWTKGHSIENYFFEIVILKKLFENYLTSLIAQEAFEIFESKFDDILRIACSLSLAGESEDLLKPIQNTLNSDIIDIDSLSESLKINTDKWSE